MVHQELENPATIFDKTIQELEKQEKGFVTGLMRTRNGEFNAYFNFYVENDISPEKIEEAFSNMAINLKVSLSVFDKEEK